MDNNVTQGRVLKWVMAAGFAAFGAWPGPAAAVDVSIVQKTDMKFGSFASDVDVPGTAVIGTAADTKTLTGGLVDFGGTVKRAKFQILGDSKAYVIVTLPSSITIAKGTSGHVMTLDTFTMSQTNPVRLNNQGKRTIWIGATLHVDADQKKGNYNDDNTFTVNVEYQ